MWNSNRWVCIVRSIPAQPQHPAAGAGQWAGSSFPCSLAPSAHAPCRSFVAAPQAPPPYIAPTPPSSTTATQVHRLFKSRWIRNNTKYNSRRLLLGCHAITVLLVIICLQWKPSALEDKKLRSILVSQRLWLAPHSTQTVRNGPLMLYIWWELMWKLGRSTA